MINVVEALNAKRSRFFDRKGEVREEAKGFISEIGQLPRPSLVL